MKQHLKSSGKGHCLTIFLFKLSVITVPPKYEAQASSKAPVMVTFASKAASTPNLTSSKSSSVLPNAVVAARAVAFAAALLLLSPFATGNI